MSNGKKILLIDDDARNIFALKLTLAARGYACFCAQEAKEGIEIARKEATGIALVLMDMMMPGMDGYEAMADMKANLQTAQLPVVAVTAQAMAGDREKCLAGGAVAYLAKPIDVDQLMELIDKHAK